MHLSERLSDEEQRVGRENFENAFGHVRRDFLRASIGAGLSLAGGMGPKAFGYGGPDDMPSPVRIGIIGTGDQGGVLIGALQPEYHEVAAICDIRPYSVHRAFHGDWASTGAKAVRSGLMSRFGWTTEDTARKNVKVYEDYRELLRSDQIEAVVVALPLHLHQQVALEALALGKHVYLETVMARTVTECKVVARAAKAQRRICSVGHQRHYNILYQTCAELIKRQTLGHILAVHAQWHRGNMPGRDSWQQPLPGGEQLSDGRGVDSIRTRLDRLRAALPRYQRAGDAKRAELLEHQIRQWQAWDADRTMDAKKFGYLDRMIHGHKRSAMEELCRWRLWERTGAGLMAELGHHQVDATLLLLDALQGRPVRPLSVFASGGRALFPDNREVEDHVHCIVRFAGAPYGPGSDVGYQDTISNYPSKEKGVPGYNEDPEKTISLIYSSTNGNGLGGYGERVLGTKGTLQMQKETEPLLFSGFSTSPVTVTGVKDGIAVTQATPLKLQFSDEQPPEAGLAQAVGASAPSRGYREGLEHWAWCIRHPAPENQPRCGPERALRNAVIVLTAQHAMKLGNGAGGVVEFRPEWFDVDSDRTPEKDI